MSDVRNEKAEWICGDVEVSLNGHGWMGIYGMDEYRWSVNEVGKGRTGVVVLPYNIKVKLIKISLLLIPF